MSDVELDHILITVLHHGHFFDQWHLLKLNITPFTRPPTQSQFETVCAKLWFNTVQLTVSVQRLCSSGHTISNCSKVLWKISFPYWTFSDGTSLFDRLFCFVLSENEPVVIPCVWCQVFDELEEMGKDIQEEVMDAGMPVHGAHGTGGDINKCPYYAAQMGTLTHNSCRLCLETKWFDPENQKKELLCHVSNTWAFRTTIPLPHCLAGLDICFSHCPFQHGSSIYGGSLTRPVQYCLTWLSGVKNGMSVSHGNVGGLLTVFFVLCLSQRPVGARRTSVSWPWPSSDTPQARSYSPPGSPPSPDWLRGTSCDPTHSQLLAVLQERRRKNREGRQEELFSERLDENPSVPRPCNLPSSSPLIFSLYYLPLTLPPSCIFSVWLVIFVALSTSLEPFFKFKPVIGCISSWVDMRWQLILLV